MVKFSGNYKLQVIGTLIADGVIFTSGKATPAKSDWLRIEFSGGSNSSVRNSIIEYANYGIYCSSSSPVITGNTIRNNTFGIGLSDNSAPLIEYNNFLNNDSAIYGSAGSTGGINPVISNNTINCKNVGIQIFGGNSITPNVPEVSGNTISECTSYGIWYRGNVHGNIENNNIMRSAISGTAIYFQGLGSNSEVEKNPRPQINHNNITGYSTKILAASYPDPSSIIINARGNWWGTADTFELSERIIDYSDNPNNPVVDWSFFLNAPYPDGMPLTGNYIVGGDLPCNSTWNAQSSPYILIGSPLVKQNCVLNVTDGTEVKAGGYFALKIDGMLSTNGATFSSLKSAPSSNDWIGIKFTSLTSPNSSIRNSRILNANRGIYIESSSPEVIGNTIEGCMIGLYLKSASPIISGNNIENNGTGISIEGNSSPEIMNNILAQQNNIFYNDSRGIFNGNISGNTIRCSVRTGTGINIVAGFYIDTMSEPLITGNDMEYCGTGIRIQGNVGGRIDGWNIITENQTGIVLLGSAGKNSRPLINNNSIYNNLNYHISVSGGYTDPANTTIDARYNYFGTIDGEEIRSKIYDYENNPLHSAKLLWEPYRDAPGGVLYMWIWLKNPIPFGFSPPGEVVDFSSSVAEPSDWVVTIKDYNTQLEVRRYTVSQTKDLTYIWTGEDDNGLMLPEGWYSWTIEAVSTVSTAVAIPQSSHILMSGIIEPTITINLEIPQGSAKARVWGEYVLFPTDNDVKGSLKVWLDNEQNPFHREQLTTYSGTYEFYYDTCGLSNSVHTFRAVVESRGILGEATASFDKNTIIPSLIVSDLEVNHDSLRSLILRGRIRFNDTGWYKQRKSRFEVKKMDSGDIVCNREYYYKTKENAFNYVCNLCSKGAGTYQIKLTVTDCGVSQEIIREVEY